MNFRILEKVKRIRRPRENNKVIVLGHQKSGTTAIARLLSEYSGMTYSNDPLYTVDYGLGEVVRNIMQEKDKLKDIIDANRKLFGGEIIKEPDFIFMMSDVLHEYKESKFIYIVRDPRDNIRSILNRLGIEPNSGKETTIKWSGMNNHWKMILQGLLPDLKMGKSSSIIANLSKRWALANQIYHQYRHRILLVKYEGFLADKKGCIEEVARNLGLDKRSDISLLLDVQYQPKGDSSVDIERFYGPENLEIINRECCEMMNMHGYS